MMEQHLKNLVDFYPVSSNQANVRRLLQYVKDCIEPHGLQVELLQKNGINSLYASTSKSKHCKILLQAHIDVVPAENQPFKAEAGKYYGRGVYDMLFAAAAYLTLFDELGHNLEKYDIGLMLSGDEEVGGFNGVLPFLEEGYTTDICILPDAGNNFGGLNVAAKGISTHTIRIHGKSHHGSRPWEGDGAGAKLLHFLSETESIFDTSDRSNSTLTIATLNAGSADNQGPPYADATLDIRYKDIDDLKRIKRELDKLLKKYDGEVLKLIEGDDYQLDLLNPHVKNFTALYEKHLGEPVEFTKAYGSSDARFFSARNIPVIMLRPDGGGAHGDNEWLSVESTSKFYELLKEYVQEAATIGDNND